MFSSSVRDRWLLPAFVTLLAGLLLTPASCGANSAANRPINGCGSSPCGDIKHVIIIVRENHSFDNLFGRFPGADGANTAWPERSGSH